MAYRRATGSVDTVDVVADTTAIAQGDLVMKDGTDNEVIAWTSGSAVFGIAKEASASGAVAKIEIDVIHPGDALHADIDSGSPAAGDLRTCDGDKNGLTVDTSSNFDFLYKYFSDSVGLVWPKLLEIADGSQ